MRSMNRVFPVISITVLLISLFSLSGLSAEEMILGKPYSISPGTEPGTYVCKWGDETVNWKPQPWHNSSYKEIGPNIYDRWTQPGLPYPWEKPVEERVKHDGREVHDRSYTALYFNEFGDNYITEWSIDLISPNGTLRDKRLFEWMVAYRQNPDGLPKSLVD